MPSLLRLRILLGTTIVPARRLVRTSVVFRGSISSALATLLLLLLLRSNLSRMYQVGVDFALDGFSGLVVC